MFESWWAKLTCNRTLFIQVSLIKVGKICESCMSQILSILRKKVFFEKFSIGAFTWKNLMVSYVTSWHHWKSKTFRCLFQLFVRLFRLSKNIASKLHFACLCFLFIRSSQLLTLHAPRSKVMGSQSSIIFEKIKFFDEFVDVDTYLCLPTSFNVVVYIVYVSVQRVNNVYHASEHILVMIHLANRFLLVSVLLFIFSVSFLSLGGGVCISWFLFYGKVVSAKERTLIVIFFHCS